MLKKYMKLSVIFITLFSFNNVYAYEFINPDNASRVDDFITEIYDAKEMYEDLISKETEEEIEIKNANNASYWWPIGSENTTEVNGKIYAKDTPYPTKITSHFGWRKDPFGSGENVPHNGTDIANGGEGVINIIAAKDGIVVYPTPGKPTDCSSSRSKSSCGGGYGNYVIIQHSDGNYTLYAHMYENTITVTAGDQVEQGQVIGKIGSSGNSTGPHLHFEVREGDNSSKVAVDALNYISLENPRVVSSGSSKIVEFINSWEGHTTIDGDYYIVEDGRYNHRIVGAGVTLENNSDKFLQYDINVDEYPAGSKIPMDIVDQIKLEIISQITDDVKNLISKNSIELEQHQIEALVSMKYNTDNIEGFVENYKEYGNTQEFYHAWFFRNVMPGTKFEERLTRRRNAEWKLFHLGIYEHN